MGHSPGGGLTPPSGQLTQRPEDWLHHPSHCPPQAPDIQQPSRYHLSFYHRYTPLPCRSGPSVDGHPQSGIGLEKAQHFGLHSVLLVAYVRPTHLFLLLCERRPRTWRRFPLSSMTLVRSSVNLVPPVYLRIDPMTAPLTSSPASRPLGAVCSPCHVRRPRQWRNTSARLLQRVLSIHLCPLLVRDSSSWGRRMDPYAFVSTTGLSTTSRSRTGTPCHWCLLPSSSCREPSYFLS